MKDLKPSKDSNYTYIQMLNKIDDDGEQYKLQISPDPDNKVVSDIIKKKYYNYDTYENNEDHDDN